MMSLRCSTPCDMDGICPYDAEYSRDCEYWCSADEPEDDFEVDEEPYDIDDENFDLELGYDPYLGCYTDDC